jgi:HPt (histidine-containing phosphotransfer) domain-containing protein/methyl-accepting chemotaxis protein
MLKRIPIRLKLVLLAGVPVIGALILATFIGRDARHLAESAAAIGSIEDLAHLSARMGKLVHTLQFERNELSLRTGQKALASPTLRQRFLQTDVARKELSDFLAARQISSLPPRLARDLQTAEKKLSALQRERNAALSGDQPIDQLLDYYTSTDLTLISATAALSQLADDGELLRAISALVIVMQIKERASQEHALLSQVFAINEFPPGTYKDLVTLTTEEADYVDMLNMQATDRVSQQFNAIWRDPEFTRATELREIALETQGDDFKVAPEEWSNTQGRKLARLRKLVIALNGAVESAAAAKVGAAARAVRLSYGLGGGVIALSALLAGLIAHGVSRSVASLAHAAEQVSKQKNFGIRALKTSDDELGSLADTFNEMLSGIEARDAELRHHGENLEQLVEQRTAALQNRNQAMRLVLDNVEQGLATIELDGKISPERSRAFDDWFGTSNGQASFAEHLAPRNAVLCETLKVAWEQVTDGFLPLEAAIDQMPRQIQVEDRRYQLSYQAIVERDVLRGALLVVSDVTRETERMRRDAEQRELIGIFERFMRDRAGFIEFFKECDALINQIVVAETDKPQLLRALHTVKGNCGIFGVDSVAEVAHTLESSILEAGSLPQPEQTAELARVWQAFATRVQRLSGPEAEPVLEVSPEELRELEACTRARAPHAKLTTLLTRLKFERGIVRLRRVAEQAKSLAQRLGKGELDVHIEASPDIRFKAERWAAFWSSFVHVVRNALDHGIESPQARVAAGKPERGKLELIIQTDAEQLTIELSDDGRGIDWAGVADKARKLGLPSSTEKDLVDALFCDGLSTAENITEISGRGVGMSAVRDATRVLGGIVTVASTTNLGTTVRFRFPIEKATEANDTGQRFRASAEAQT